MSNTLRIDQHTSVQQLRQFLNDSAPGSKLRGREIAGGGYELYLGKSSSLMDRLSGKARDRNEAASAGIKMVFKNFEQLSQQNGIDKENRSVKSLFRQVDKSCDLESRKALRSDDVLKLARGVARIGHTLGLQANPPLPPAPTPSAHQLAARGPNVAMTIDAMQLMHVSNLLLGATTDAGKDAAITGMAGLIDTAIGTANLSAKDMKALALSNGGDVRSQVLTAVTAKLAQHGQTVPDGFGAIFDKAFDKFAETKLGTKQTTAFVPTQIDSQGANVSKDLPEIEIGGNQYKATKQIGEGGLGDVYLYENKADPSDRIAFKICKTNPQNENSDQIRGATISEVLAHDTAQAGGSPNVLAMEGVVRLSNGSIGIAMEAVPHGSVYDLATTLKDYVGTGPGKLTQEQANVIRLTIVRDMLLGLQALEGAGLMHLDFKSPNCLIGSDGRTKVIDFGTAKETGQLAYEDFPSEAENPRYLSPEYQQAKKDVEDHVETNKSSKADDLKAAIKLIYPNADAKEQEKISRNVAGWLGSSFTEEAITSLNPTVDRKHDAWGAGIALLELFQGRGLFPEISFGSGVTEGLLQWASSGRDALAPNTAGPLPRDGQGKLLAIGRSTGDPEIDDLLNRMLAPDPANRISLADALRHPAFAKDGVGDPATLAFIPKMLAGRSPFMQKQDLLSSMRDNVLAQTDARLSGFKDELSAQDAQLLDSKSLTRQDRYAMIAKLSPQSQAAMQHLVDRMNQGYAQVDAFDQQIATYLPTLAQDKAAFDRVT